MFILSTKFEYFGIIHFWVILQILVQKNALIEPVTLTFQSENHIASRISQGHSYIKFEHFKIIGFEFQTDRKSNKQTDLNVLPDS